MDARLCLGPAIRSSSDPQGCPPWQSPGGQGQAVLPAQEAGAKDRLGCRVPTGRGSGIGGASGRPVRKRACTARRRAGWSAGRGMACRRRRRRSRFKRRLAVMLFLPAGRGAPAPSRRMQRRRAGSLRSARKSVFRGRLSGAGEGVAHVDVARVVAALEPVVALLGGAVGEAVGHHAAH